MEARQSMRSSDANCSVVGCSNSYRNTQKGIVFYSFENKRFPGRKEKWIAAVRRLGSNGKPWQPGKYSLICSTHFIGGKKSDHPHSPAYVPTLMPERYKSKGPLTCVQSRFERSKSRSTQLQVPADYAGMSQDEIVIPNLSQIENQCTVGIQTDIYVNNDITEKSVFLFSESISGYNGLTASVGTQTDIFLTTDSSKPTPVLKSPTRDMKCGPDVRSVGFSGFESVKDDEELTGLCGINLETFGFLLTRLTGKVSSKLSMQNRLMLFLIKFKLGLSFAALSVLFGVHRTTASKHFFSILEELIVKCSDIVFWPSKSSVKMLLPPSFANFPNLRCIIDCTELRCEKPPEVHQQVLLYSNYKGTYTVKYLIGITPNGFISYISPGYGGRSSDTYITSNSGILELLQPGDEIMADKGFPQISTDLENKSVKLIMPAFASAGNQFSKEQVDETYNIASVRIHVERIIARIRTFHILDKITIDMLPYVDSVMRICCILVNLKTPIIKTES